MVVYLHSLPYNRPCLPATLTTSSECGKLKTNHIGHTGYLNTVTVSPDGSLCASGGKVTCHTMGTALTIWCLSMMYTFCSNLYLCDDKEAVSDSDLLKSSSCGQCNCGHWLGHIVLQDGQAMLWDLNEGKHLYTLDSGDVINALCFSPNRYWLWTATVHVPGLVCRWTGMSFLL